jgi:hypothetical protein
VRLLNFSRSPAAGRVKRSNAITVLRSVHRLPQATLALRLQTTGTRFSARELGQTGGRQIPVEMIGLVLVMRQSRTDDLRYWDVLTGRTHIDLARHDRRIFSRVGLMNSMN